MDRAFFLLETEQRPMNVGVLVVLQGRRTARGRPGDNLVRRMLRCPVGPPFNQRLAENVVAGWPVLMEDDSINPEEQVFRHDLPEGSDVQALFDRVTRSASIAVAPCGRCMSSTGLPGTASAFISRPTTG